MEQKRGAPSQPEQQVFAMLATHSFLGMLQAVVKAMELLALEGKIKEKIYGKQKIYFADQVQFSICIVTYAFGINVCEVPVTAALTSPSGSV